MLPPPLPDPSETANQAQLLATSKEEECARASIITESDELLQRLEYNMKRNEKSLRWKAAKTSSKPSSPTNKMDKTDKFSNPRAPITPSQRATIGSLLEDPSLASTAEELINNFLELLSGNMCRVEGSELIFATFGRPHTLPLEVIVPQLLNSGQFDAKEQGFMVPTTRKSKGCNVRIDEYLLQIVQAVQHGHDTRVSALKHIAALRIMHDSRTISDGVTELRPSKGSNMRIWAANRKGCRDRQCQLQFVAVDGFHEQKSEYRFDRTVGCSSAQAHIVDRLLKLIDV